MAVLLWKLILIAIILNYSLIRLAKADGATTSDEPDDLSGECDDSEECEDSQAYFSQKLQNNYVDSFVQIQQFFKSTSSVLKEINEKLALLEKSDGEIKQKLGLLEKSDGAVKQNLDVLNQGEQNVNKQLGHLMTSDMEINRNLRLLNNADKVHESTLTGINQRMQRFEHQIATTTIAHQTTTIGKPLNAEDQLRSLTQPVKGNSFHGLSTQQIARFVPDVHALAVEVVNYLDGNLKDYKLNLKWGSEYQRAPTSVKSKTREIFTFKQKAIHIQPQGVFLYRIEDAGVSLHVFFLSLYGQYAAAFLDNNAPIETLLPVDNNCPNYIHRGSWSSFRCIKENDYVWPTTRTFTIHQGFVYAKLTINFEKKTTILKIEIFKFEA